MFEKCANLTPSWLDAGAHMLLAPDKKSHMLLWKIAL